ncbi:MAG: beta-propeller domain-containing protein [Candidatus Kerfeldbacteria bacterium]|nr:beta-propeller domain-containing protein [Candidatus Kerfeldbacteria bacterium]
MTKIFSAVVTLMAITVVGLLLIFSSGFSDLLKENTPTASAAPLPTFASCTDLEAKIDDAVDARKSYRNVGSGGITFFDASKQLGLAPASESAVSDADYSETNVQVEGVDESDTVKTDGEYIYTVSNGKLVITKAYPVEDATVASKTDLGDLTPTQLFLDENRVLIFGSRIVSRLGDAGDSSEGEQEITSDVYPYPRSGSVTSVELWDVKDREHPKRVRVSDVEGWFVTARKIESDVYFVVESSVYEYLDAKNPVPMFRDETGKDIKTLTTSFEPAVGCSSVHYFEPIHTESYITLVSLPMDDDDGAIEKTVVMGRGENVYASLQNLYVAESDYGYRDRVGIIQPLEKVLPGDVLPEPETKTVVHKFALEKGKTTYVGNGEAPGTILNQFSMDEHEDSFRIATTKGHVARGGGSATNNVAPGEQIYSARFMGDRAYLVTFKKVDPLFVIDLADPKSPKVLGKLKIPGYSDYLHPYDDTHIIGIGKETIEAEEGDFAWYQGVKIALFDVTDPSNPTQMDVEVIGDRGTDSPLLTDHKALLFDRGRNLFVIPILLAEIDESVRSQETRSSFPSYGDYVYQGAYVYRLTLDGGFELRGRITHVTNQDDFLKSGYFYPSTGESVTRSLFIDDVLYTLSERFVKANALEDLGELKTVELFTKDEIGSTGKILF